ncbi:hypothetical protein GQ44DRAFT_4142 [Phaeosphaeriaceae sp. PMI808]|nr:hypothetical protein GQ44DRAFT_4142 [Phaeosphaeriaceae sp. PMI808]
MIYQSLFPITSITTSYIRPAALPFSFPKYSSIVSIKYSQPPCAFTTSSSANPATLLLNPSTLSPKTTFIHSLSSIFPSKAPMILVNYSQSSLSANKSLTHLTKTMPYVSLAAIRASSDMPSSPLNNVSRSSETGWLTGQLVSQSHVRSDLLYPDCILESFTRIKGLHSSGPRRRRRVTASWSSLFWGRRCIFGGGNAAAILK